MTTTTNTRTTAGTDAEALCDQLASGGRDGDPTITMKGALMGDFLMMRKAELVRLLKSARRDGFA